MELFRFWRVCCLCALGMQISAAMSVARKWNEALWRPGASVDGPLFHPLSVYLFLPLFLKKKSNTDPQRHNHAALPFSNISCPPLFLSMRLNWCKTINKKTLAHTIQCREKQSFFFPPQFHSACTKTFCPTNIFIGTLGSHRLNSAKQRGKDFLFFNASSLCVFACGPQQHVEVLSVSDSLVCHRLSHMTRSLDRSRPLIPNKWFLHSDSNTMI